MDDGQTLLTKKRRGPKPTGKGTLIGVRLQPDLLDALDAYRLGDCPEGTSRPEALRRVFTEWAGLGDIPANEVDAAPEDVPERLSDEEWWSGLSEVERAEILDGEGIKRSPQHPWRTIGRGVQNRLGRVRERLDDASSHR